MSMKFLLSFCYNFFFTNFRCYENSLRTSSFKKKISSVYLFRFLSKICVSFVSNFKAIFLFTFHNRIAILVLHSTVILFLTLGDVLLFFKVSSSYHKVLLLPYLFVFLFRLFTSHQLLLLFRGK